MGASEDQKIIAREQYRKYEDDTAGVEPREISAFIYIAGHVWRQRMEGGEKNVK